MNAERQEKNNKNSPLAFQSNGEFFVECIIVLYASSASFSCAL